MRARAWHSSESLALFAVLGRRVRDAVLSFRLNPCEEQTEQKTSRVTDLAAESSTAAPRGDVYARNLPVPRDAVQAGKS